MTIKEIVEQIENNFLKLSEDCKEDLMLNSKILHLEKNTILVREGEFSNKSYFIAKGCARAYYLKDGKDINDWFAFENNFITSINSYFLNQSSPHFIETLESSIILELSRDKIIELCSKYPEFDRLEKMAITHTMLLLQQRIMSIQFESAAQKYENLIQLRPDITQRIQLTHIASYLGISLETLSRIRNPKNII